MWGKICACCWEQIFDSSLNREVRSVMNSSKMFGVNAHIRMSCASDEMGLISDNQNSR